MATDVTAMLLLERVQSEDLIGGRDFTHILILDEGHDRPVWEWLKKPRNMPVPVNLVPSCAERILLEGLQFILSGAGISSRQDFGAPGKPLSGFRISLIAFDSSSFAEQLTELEELGSAFCIYSNDPPADWSLLDRVTADPMAPIHALMRPTSYGYRGAYGTDVDGAEEPDGWNGDALGVLDMYGGELDWDRIANAGE